GNDRRARPRYYRPARMKVAFIVHTFDMGGLERCIAHLVNHLDRDRFRPMIICLNRNGDAAKWLHAENVPIVELRKRPGNDLRAVHGLARILRTHAVDLVHSQNWCTLVETVLARRWAGVPYHLHGQQGAELAHLRLRGWGGRLRAQVLRWALGQTDLVVAVAESLRRYLMDMCCFSGRRIRVIPNGVEIRSPEELARHRDRIRRQLGITDGAVLVGSVGRLVEVKGFG